MVAAEEKNLFLPTNSDSKVADPFTSQLL